MVGATTGFEQFWQLYVLQYGAPILQMLLWIVQIVAFAYGVVLFKRLVDSQTGRTKAAASGDADMAADTDQKVDIEEFVE